MKKTNSVNKEALKEFLDELLSKKFSKEQLLEKAGLTDADGDVEEEEVLIEPFALIDDEIHEFVNLNELIDDDDNVKLTEEEIAYYNEVTEDIKPVDSLMLDCFVGSEKRMLVNEINCNIKVVPIMNLVLLTPFNLKVLKVALDSDMETEEEIEVTVALTHGNEMVAYKFDLATLILSGLVVITDSLEGAIDLKPLEYRGLTAPVSVDELNEISNKGGM